MFDWDQVVEHAELTPTGLYEAIMNAYIGPRTTSIRELAEALAEASYCSPKLKQRQAATFVLLLLTFKLARRSDPDQNHEDLKRQIREVWDSFIRPESPQSVIITDLLNIE